MANKVQLLDNRWDDQKAATLDEPGKLLYRSNLLGADKRITNYGGGNTSAKVSETDPLTGKPVEVLWVKGSGGDVGTIKLDGFATLYMEKLESLKSIYKGVADEDRMVGFLPHCTFNLNSRAASIDTPLHGFVPFRHVDHMHPDAIIAIAASKNSRELTKEVFGDEIGWLPWRRPGFQLGLDLGAYAAAHPNSKGVVLESHGLFTWADDAKECYELTLDIINMASCHVCTRCNSGHSRCGRLPAPHRALRQRRPDWPHRHPAPAGEFSCAGNDRGSWSRVPPADAGRGS